MLSPRLFLPLGIEAMPQDDAVDHCIDSWCDATGDQDPNLQCATFCQRITQVFPRPRLRQCQIVDFLRHSIRTHVQQHSWAVIGQCADDAFVWDGILGHFLFSKRCFFDDWPFRPSAFAAQLEKRGFILFAKIVKKRLLEQDETSLVCENRQETSSRYPRYSNSADR